MTVQQSDTTMITKRQAKRLIHDVIADFAHAEQCVERLWREQAWTVLGYETWEELCENEFAVLREMSKINRRALVGTMTQKGMSTRAQASAFGVGKSTIDRDRQVSQNGTPAKVVGLDGKTYRSPAPQARSEDETNVVADDQGTRPGGTTWSRTVEGVSAECPMDKLTVVEVEELHGAATFLRDYCSGHLALRDVPEPEATLTVADAAVLAPIVEVIKKAKIAATHVVAGNMKGARATLEVVEDAATAAINQIDASDDDLDHDHG